VPQKSRPSSKLKYLKTGLHISPVAGNIALDYFVYFLQKIDFLIVLVLSNIASFIACLKACAKRALG
jgi:hypothetical protein